MAALEEEVHVKWHYFQINSNITRRHRSCYPYTQPGLSHHWLCFLDELGLISPLLLLLLLEIRLAWQWCRCGWVALSLRRLSACDWLLKNQSDIMVESGQIVGSNRCVRSSSRIQSLDAFLVMTGSRSCRRRRGLASKPWRMFPGCRCKKKHFFRICFAATTLLAEILDLPRTVGARREVAAAPSWTTPLAGCGLPRFRGLLFFLRDTCMYAPWSVTASLCSSSSVDNGAKLVAYLGFQLWGGMRCRRRRRCDVVEWAGPSPEKNHFLSPKW